MLYVCIPVYNEATTVGVLLWRLRTVLQEAGRDYEVVVYDDASTDATAEVLAPYARVLPLTVLGGAGNVSRGRTAATTSLLLHVAAQSRHPRRDACILLQGDFTERPEDVPALLAAFDTGADVVVGRRAPDPAQPPAERRLRHLASWVLRPLVRVDGVDDLLAGPRLLRVTVVRDLARARGDRPLLTWAGWAGVAELVVTAVPHARRIAVVDTPGRYDVRTRASRTDWALELRTLARYAWRARGTRARPHAERALAADQSAAWPDAGLAAPVAPGDPSPIPPAAPRIADALRAATPTDREERPRTVGRSRRARREPDAPVAALSTPAAISTAALTHDLDVTTSLPTSPDAGPDDASVSARRRKRRARRRSRPEVPTGEPGAETTGDASSADAFADTLSADVPTTPQRNADPPATPADTQTGEDDAVTTHASDDPSEASDAPGRTKRRRKRRSRGRSAEGPTGVDDVTAERIPAEPSQHDGSDAGAPPT